MWRWRDDDGYEGGEAANGRRWCGAEEMERVQVVGRWLRWGGSHGGGDVYGGGSQRSRRNRWRRRNQVEEGGGS
ncbi:hypothetical protein Tco_1529138, partial [Tanacetum coccineum]